MAEGIHVPGLGELPRPLLYGGAIVTVVIVGVAWSRHQNSQSAQAPAATTAPDPSIDPNTGIPYAQEQAAYGYTGVPSSSYGGSFIPSGGNQIGVDAYGNPVYGVGGGSGSTGLQTNSAWATQAEADLLTTGVTEQVAALAISRVLAGLPVTTDQEAIFLQATGLDGQPPQGYPKPIKLTDTPGQPGGSGTPPPAGQVTVPGIIGQGYGSAHNAIVRAGLKPSPFSGINSSYKVTGQSPAGGSKVARGSTVKLTVKA